MTTPPTPSKDELERQKLTLEILELQRKWWQRPVYLSVLLPMVLAILTVLAGILSGYFNRERRQLARDIEILKEEKSALIESAKQLSELNFVFDKEFRKLLREAKPRPSATPSSN